MPEASLLYGSLTRPAEEVVPAQAMPDIGLDSAPLPTRGDPHSVPVVDTGEPLVPLVAQPYLHAYAQAGWPACPAHGWVRRTVAHHLSSAEGLLPAGFGLAVFDAWRHPDTVRALYERYYGPDSTLETGFLADPDRTDIIPPHLTGGAVDVTLTWSGIPLALGTPFDEFSPLAHADAFEDGVQRAHVTAPTATIVRSCRRLLRAIMHGAGFVGVPEEWWHFSFGDQAHAAAVGTRVAPFGATRPVP